jgi:hypothetical protein
VCVCARAHVHKAQVPGNYNAATHTLLSQMKTLKKIRTF